MSFSDAHKKILEALKDSDLRTGSKIGTKFEQINRINAINSHPYVKDWAKEVKEGKTFNDESYIKKFLENFSTHGGIYHFAKDGNDAKKIILNILNNEKLIVKSKSLVGEEIELRQFLESNGKQVFETDLGEFLVQITNGRPAHMVTPAVNMTEVKARRVLRPYIGDVGNNVEDIVLAVRSFMREKFLNADAGIVGANALAAETGSVIFITNEGNGALTQILPKKIIIITSIEKIYKSLLDAIKETYVQTIFDGFKAVSYIHIMNEFHSKEVHLVLLDNGRSEARGTFLEETLYCIKCGACQLSCPIFKEIDGAWGYIYTAAIGIPWTFITGHKEIAKDLSYFCLSCGRCKEVCPMEIDIPEIIRKIKGID